MSKRETKMFISYPVDQIEHNKGKMNTFLQDFSKDATLCKVLVT